MWLATSRFAALRASKTGVPGTSKYIIYKYSNDAQQQQRIITAVIVATFSWNLNLHLPGVRAVIIGRVEVVGTLRGQYGLEIVRYFIPAEGFPTVPIRCFMFSHLRSLQDGLLFPSLVLP